MNTKEFLVAQFFSGQPWVERLGWTLVQFLWQGALIAAVYAVARRWAGASRSAQVRHQTRWPLSFYCRAGTAWTEIGIGEGTGRRTGHRPRGEGLRELKAIIKGQSQ